MSDYDDEEVIDIYPEHFTVEDFAQFCMDDEQTTFTAMDVTMICFCTHQRRQDVRKELEGYGLQYIPPKPVKRVRGFSDNPHDRWYGPGADRTYANSGWEQIAGFAGDKSREGW